MRLLTKLCIVGLALISTSVYALDSDVVARGDVANDWMASLAASGTFGPNINPSEFTTEPTHTREQCAVLLEDSIFNDPSAIAKIDKSDDDSALVRDLIHVFQQQLFSDGYDIPTLLGKFSQHVVGGSLTIQPQLRVNTEGSSSPGTGPELIVRSAVGGTAGRDLSYNLSVSNWYDDWRRDIYNDLGPQDFDYFNQGYVELSGKHNFELKIGRMYDQWGPAQMGGTMLSANSPAFDQAEMSFPFSLGKHLGQNWNFTQTLGTYDETGQRRYFQARKLEYRFNSKWSIDYQESLKSITPSSALLVIFPSYLKGKEIDTSYTDTREGTDSAGDLVYSINPDTRLYGELTVDDYKDPFTHSPVPVAQKLSWLVGGEGKIGKTTDLTLEVAETNQTTYTFHTTAAPWTHGTDDWMGLFTGPNAVDVYSRLQEKLGKETTIAVSGRERWREDNSYPAPSSSEYGVYLTQNIGQRDSFELDALEYRQDPYPFQPGQPGYPPANPFAPLSYADPGFYARLGQVDMTFSITY